MYLKFPTRPPVPVNKAYFTVGCGKGFDAMVPGTYEQMYFTLHLNEGRVTLIPGTEKLWVNGRAVSKPVELLPCDRIQWKGHVAVCLDDCAGQSTGSAMAGRTDFALECLEVLQQLSCDLENGKSLGLAMERVLFALAEIAGAEFGFIISDMGTDNGWEWIASVGAAPDGESPDSGDERRKQLISNTILNEAIRKRKPVYVESIVGHPWAEQASILGAQIYSIGCLPLIVEERVFGCVYLYTRTPGRSIRKQALGQLGILATQAALLLASRAELRRTQRENHELKRRSSTSDSPLIHFDADGSSAMRDVNERIARLAPTNLAILVCGETGTGKELVARELHRLGGRPSGPFVAINCGAIPPTLIESTFFGYVKGAFTGAQKDQPGKFQQADGGTLFLDEIADLPLDLQVKLLRVLQEKRVEPVGGHVSREVDFRVVAATHQDLEALVEQGKFRQDLYYRLNGARILTPPLRERPDDVSFLARHFLEKMGSPIGFSEAALHCLRSHSWPGNVRELEQVVSRAASLAQGEEIVPADLEISTPLAGSRVELGKLRDAQSEFTSQYIRATLEKFNGNRGQAASHLGISERTLYRILSPDRNDSHV